MVFYANKIVGFKDMYKDTKKIFGGGDENSRDLRGGRTPPLEYLPILNKMIARQRREHF